MITMVPAFADVEFMCFLYVFFFVCTSVVVYHHLSVPLFSVICVDTFACFFVYVCGFLISVFVDLSLVYDHFSALLHWFVAPTFIWSFIRITFLFSLLPHHLHNRPNPTKRSCLFCHFVQVLVGNPWGRTGPDTFESHTSLDVLIHHACFNIFGDGLLCFTGFTV